MRTLLLMRGAPASGKSQWIRDNNLEAYTLEADHFRMLLRSPSLVKTAGIFHKRIMVRPGNSY